MASSPLTDRDRASRAGSARVGLALLVLALAMAGRGLAGGDPIGAAAMVEWAEAESDGDLTHPAWIDAARELNGLRPWHPGFREARRRLAEIGAARRSAVENEDAD